jgi:hypothetical protein
MGRPSPLINRYDGYYIYYFTDEEEELKEIKYEDRTRWVYMTL